MKKMSALKNSVYGVPTQGENCLGEQHSRTNDSSLDFSLLFPCHTPCNTECMDSKLRVWFLLVHDCRVTWYSIGNQFTICSLDSSVGKESACNAGDPGLIPGLGRSTGEGIGYPLQYSWASLVAQLVKNSPVMWKTWVRSLGWEDPLEKGKATHSSILAWRIPWTI